MNQTPRVLNTGDQIGDWVVDRAIGEGPANRPALIQAMDNHWGKVVWTDYVNAGAALPQIGNGTPTESPTYRGR